MDERWRLSFSDYLSDILETIGPCPGKGFTLDRINNDGNYEPGNVRWATQSQQKSNQRKVNLLQVRIIELEARVAQLEAEVAELKGKPHDFS